MIDCEKVKKLALENGFKLKEQASGNLDLNSYVYDFAEALLKDKQAEIDSLKAQLRELNDTVQHLKTESSGVHAALREQQSTNEDLLEKLFGVDAGEYVVVPKEPTEAMIKHAYGTYEGATILPYSFYKAMIEGAEP